MANADGADSLSPSDEPEALSHDPYSLPHTLVSTEAWVDTGETLGGASSGRRVRTMAGRSGVRKPGNPIGGSVEPFREIVAVHVARWIGASVPAGELYATGDGLPCFISFDVGPTALTGNVALNDPVGQPHRDRAVAALSAYAAIVVLDCLVADTDRGNLANHLYVPTDDLWYGIDYAYSFNTSDRCGIGDATAPYRMTYFPQLIEALRAAPGRLRTALALAEAIPEEQLKALIQLPPPNYATPEVRERMLDFLTNRRARLRPMLAEWCKMNALDGTVDNA